MNTLLNWIDSIPPLTMGQFLIVALPFALGQILVAIAVWRS